MLRMIFLLILTITLCPAPAPAQETKNALLVVSSHGREGGEVQPGFELDELAQAWLVLSANGYDVQIGSPEGGAVVADEYDPAKAYNQEFLANPLAASRLADTLRLDTKMADRFDIILIIGGKGAMFDLPNSQVLQQILLAQYDRGGVVAAVCHGPAVLAQIRREDGTAFVAGKRLSAFTDEEEEAFGKKWVASFPFLIESRFREQGAKFGEAAIMLPHVEVDGKLVTGQNPFSVVAATEAAIRADGGSPKARTMWADERSMHLVAKAAAGDRQPLLDAIAANPSSLDIPMMAAWAYYRGMMSQEDAQVLRLSIAILKLAEPHMDEPQLASVLARFEQQYAELCDGAKCNAS